MVRIFEKKRKSAPKVSQCKTNLRKKMEIHTFLHDSPLLDQLLCRNLSNPVEFGCIIFKKCKKRTRESFPIKSSLQKLLRSFQQNAAGSICRSKSLK